MARYIRLRAYNEGKGGGGFGPLAIRQALGHGPRDYLQARAMVAVGRSKALFQYCVISASMTRGYAPGPPYSKSK